MRAGFLDTLFGPPLTLSPGQLCPGPIPQQEQHPHNEEAQSGRSIPKSPTMLSKTKVVSIGSEGDNEIEEAPPKRAYQSVISDLPLPPISSGSAPGPGPKCKRKRRDAEEESVLSERPPNRLHKKKLGGIKLAQSEEPRIELRLQRRKKRRLLIMSEKLPEKTPSAQKASPLVQGCYNTHSHEPHLELVRHDNPERFHFVRTQDGKENSDHEGTSWASENQLDDGLPRARLGSNMPGHEIRELSDSQHGLDTPKRNKSTGIKQQKTALGGKGGHALSNATRSQSSNPAEPRAQVSKKGGRENQGITRDPSSIASKLQDSQPPISLPGGMADPIQISTENILNQYDTPTLSTTPAGAFKLFSLGRKSVRSKEVIWTGTISDEDDLQDGSEAQEEENRHKSPLALEGLLSREDEPASKKGSCSRGNIIDGGRSVGKDTVELESTFGLETLSHKSAPPTLEPKSNNPVKAPTKQNAAQSIPNSEAKSAPPQSKHIHNPSQRLAPKTDAIPSSRSLHEAKRRKASQRTEAPLLPAQKPRDEAINRGTPSSPPPPPRKPITELPARAVQSMATQIVTGVAPAEANTRSITPLLPKPTVAAPPRIPNPATRGCKAAKKSDAAGLEPKSFLAADLLQAAIRPRPQGLRRPPLAQPLPRSDNGEKVGDVHVMETNKNDNIAVLPGFQWAGGGPWSAEAGDLLGMGRPGS